MSTTTLSFIVTFSLLHQQFSGRTIHLAGDSTLSVQIESKRPGTGWGEPFSSMVCDGVRVINHAKNGRSTRSFLAEGLWADLIAQIQMDDIVMIQFGHNDQKVLEPELYSEPWLEYKKNLQRFVSDVRAHGAEPILLTSIVRRVFNTQGKLKETLGDYPLVTRAVAKQMNVALVDLNAATHELLEAKGIFLSKNLYLHLAPDVHENYPEGIQDDTHLNTQGAIEVASLVAAELQDKFPGLICW